MTRLICLKRMKILKAKMDFRPCPSCNLLPHVNRYSTYDSKGYTAHCTNECKNYISCEQLGDYEGIIISWNNLVREVLHHDKEVNEEK